MITNEERPHLDALRHAAATGFRFLHLREPDRVTIAAIHAERRLGAVIETVTVRAMREAIAARRRAEEYPAGDPLWERCGAVADVIEELLALPPHGVLGAPCRTRRTSTSLWLPTR